MTRHTVRWRLTGLYSGLFLLSGAALLVVTYLLVAGGFPVIQLRGVSDGDGILRICARQDGSVVTDGRFDACAEQARDMMAAQQAETLRLLLLRSGAALAIMTGVSVWLGWLMAGRVLRPLRTITATTRRISAGDLHQRLAMPGRRDELRELGDTIDGLLTRLEAAFDAQRQFVANASHELRTPLARQRTLLEVALADPAPTAVNLAAVCRRALAAGEQQERLIEALLTLARGERGLDRRDPLDLRAMAGAVVEARCAEAAARTVRIDTDLAGAPVRGDARLAERLVANLVDNAIRHNTPNGTVEVSTGTRGGMATLTVTNSGPVIPPEKLDQLFQPFARLAPDRTTTRDGLGLGLPIVAAIATAHDAHLDARPRPDGGLTVTLALPADEPARE
ncbi:sensor histidine kinase [Actinophytocola oryzae]|uniref:histidine kinase n=1 Tax=Actinophytocola oryzae TaxID=502181 RepID=A0A4R7V3G6_9PSEU|nr:HAMP domain-containing sensor histidine kinase [Actinophytocola oryzae]TDV43224.1 signal transduction histidine kinase [Actinophytocola oryzae]